MSETLKIMQERLQNVGEKKSERFDLYRILMCEAAVYYIENSTRAGVHAAMSQLNDYFEIDDKSFCCGCNCQRIVAIKHQIVGLRFAMELVLPSAT